MTWILLVGYTLLLGTADTMFSRQRMSMVRGIAYFTLMAAAFCRDRTKIPQRHSKQCVLLYRMNNL